MNTRKEKLPASKKLSTSKKLLESNRRLASTKRRTSKRPSKPRHASPDGTPLRQVAALPYRKNAKGAIEVLLVTSRGKKRVIIPKGWQEIKKPWKAAEKEAREEGGVVGKIRRRPIGYFEYWKSLADHFALVRVDVFSLKVEKTLRSWPEKRQRLVKWLTTADAALLVDEPRLISMLASFTGHARKRQKAKAKKKVGEERRVTGTLLVVANPAGAAATGATTERGEHSA